MTDFDETQIEKLLAYEANGRPLVEVIVEDFHRDFRVMLLKIKNSASVSDIAAIKSCVHALRSPAATLGLKGFEQACAELEHGEFAPEILKAKIEALERKYNQALNWLGQQTRSKRAS